MISAKLKIDLKPLEKYIEYLTVSGQGGFDAVMLKWLVRYKKAQRAAFNKNSSGGGSWPRLKEPIRKRVKKKSKQILRDSDTIRGATEPIPTLQRFPAPGAITSRIRNGIKIGFGGGAKHPYAKLTIGRLIMIHHNGLGRVPARPIVITPSEAMKARMVDDLKSVANAAKRNM